jgi:hypothetical protein
MDAAQAFPWDSQPVANERALPGKRSAGMRRPIMVGFIVGFVIAIPATFLALLFTWAERLLPVVVPGRFLVRPLSRYAEHWNGAVNMGLVSIANGLSYAVIAAAIAGVVLVARSR